MGCVIVLFLHQIGHGKVRKKICETALCLRDQRIPVRQKENIPDPAMFQQNLDKRNDGSRLAGTGRHDEECLAAVLFPETVAHSLDRRFLIITACDIFIDNNIGQA